MNGLKVALDNKISNINFEDLVPYCIFPNSFIRNGKIPPQQKVLFEILCSYDFMDKEGKRKGWCDPSLDTISGQMGLKKRAVQVHLKRLVEGGLVTVIYRNNATEGHRSSIYVLNILPGLSDADLKRIALTRNLDIKHLVSGLNTIKVQTSEGMKDIANEEFDLQYIVTGQRASEIIEGEIATPEDIISDDEEADVSVFEREGLTNELKNDNKNTKQEVQDNEDDIKISFKKSTVVINPSERRKQVKSEEFNSKDAVSRMLAGNYDDLKPLDYCKYFKHKYEIKYPTEKLIIDRIKDTVAIKNRLKDMEPEVLVQVLEYYIENYHRLFYTNEYRRPKIYQLGIAWVFNKLLENFYYAQKSKIDETPQEIKTEEVRRQVF